MKKGRWVKTGDTTYYILLAVYAVWMCCGVFPLVCYEGDSSHVIVGCTILCDGGVEFPPPYSYAYDMQPLVSYVVVALKHIVPCLTCENIYCLLSAMASFVFMVGSISLLHRLTGVGKIVLLLAHVLIPETYASGIYANTSVLAAAVFIFALLFVANGKRMAGCLFLSVAPLFRIDIVIIYPAIFMFFLLLGDSKRKAFLYSAFTALSVIVVVALGCLALHANPIESTMAEYAGMNADKHFSGYVPLAVYTFYTVVNIVLLPWGIVSLLRSRKHALMLFGIIPILLIHYFFRNTGCATKHYLYLIPFVCIFTSNVLSHIILKLKSVCRFAFFAFLFLYMIVSIRFPFRSTPSANVANSVGTIAPRIALCTENVTPLHVTVGIGAGQLLSTFDEMMLLTGNAFYPFFIHENKEFLLSCRNDIYNKVEAVGKADIVCVGWESIAFFYMPWCDQGCRTTVSYEHGHLTFYIEDCAKPLSFTMIDTYDELAPYFAEKHQPNTFVVPYIGSPYELDVLARKGLVRKVTERLYKILPCEGK